jgi:riboflavin kinase/FMN adenylyltransferase
MNFIRGLNNYPLGSPKKSLITIGTFDGIHKGHQVILKKVMDESRQYDLEPVLITFHPHPKVVVTPENIPLLLTALEEKKQFIPHFFDGNVLVMDFNEQLMNLSAELFVKEVLIDKLNVSKVIVGYDHAFGKNRSGGINELKDFADKYKFDIEVIGPVMYKDEAISSSRIRKATLNNDYEEALEMLGHDYAIFGTVERGIGLGRRLGYPTANVAYDIRKLLPPEGVYACWAQIDGEEKDGMMFIGKNHFNPQKRITVEANLFDFDRDIYNREITVYATRFVRPNQKFETTEELVEQIKKDKEKVIEIIKKEKDNVVEQRSKSSNYR